MGIWSHFSYYGKCLDHYFCTHMYVSSHGKSKGMCMYQSFDTLAKYLSRHIVLFRVPLAVNECSKIQCFLFVFCLFVFVFFFFLYPWNIDVPRLGVELEIQLPAYATATATRDPGCICDLHHSSGQCWVLNPLSKAKD